MRPDERDLDEEIRGHLAISVRERIDRGEDPEAARLAALREFGYVPAIRDSMHGVWMSRPVEHAAALWRDVRLGMRALARARGLAATVVVTLALGIGANAAIFSVVREVLLRPLVNDDPDRLIYIRQSAPGLGAANTMFSVPEMRDLEARVPAVGAFGDFSTIEFPVNGLGEPRVVQAGVVGGSYFDVMGLRPALGRLLGPADDGPEARGAVVLTHRFWSGALAADPAVVGRIIRLGARPAVVVGVLEPSIPYPADTALIANVVTSPHHLGATMVTERRHRMTELFGRLAPGATLDDARAQLSAAHTAMARAHPDAYPESAAMRVAATPLAEQIAAPARTILLVLLASAALVFLIACANAASLILARAVRRESELAVRAALGASRGALRRMLLGETLVLCGAGAVLGVLVARPLATAVGRFAARYSVRALDVTVDASLLWVGAGLAVAAAVALAFVPRLPAPHGPAAPAGARIAPATRRRLRAFAVTQVALSFVLVAVAGMLLSAVVALQSAATGYDMRQVLALDVPMSIETPGPAAIDFYQRASRRISGLPRVRRVAMSNFVPWRDSGALLPPFAFTADGFATAPGEDLPRARLRNVTPGFFDAVGIRLVAGREFTDGDRRDAEPVVVVSRSVARRLSPDADALNRRVWWVNPLFGQPVPRRIVGIVEDVDDENVAPGPALTIYHPFGQMPYGGRLFVRAEGDPYALVAPVTRAIRDVAAEQPVAHAATLADVRAEVLAPERLNAWVVAVFGGVALLIAVVGVAGVLAFSVSARTHEFGVRLAVGSSPRSLLLGVLAEGLAIAGAGIAAGAAGGYLIARIAAASVAPVGLPGALATAGAAIVLGVAAVAASLAPALRASRVDVTRALRSE